MIDYIYDGSFEGLLSCIYQHYYNENAAGIYTEDKYQPSLLVGSKKVITDEENADKVYDAILRKISAYDLRRIYKAYLSTENEKEMKILRYVVKGFKYGSKISMLHGDDEVVAIQNIEKKINNEKERMLQFVRFSETKDGILYAEITPDHDVLELIGEHFSKRYRNEAFIIMDRNRNKGMFSQNGSWYIGKFELKEKPEMAEEEYEYRKLWKNYFENIAIKERKNTKCQTSHMPRRYQKNLTEINTLL